MTPNVRQDPLARRRIAEIDSTYVWSLTWTVICAGGFGFAHCKIGRLVARRPSPGAAASFQIFMDKELVEYLRHYPIAPWQRDA
jgi:hypothetical protein